jgi:hypothetical protein
MRATWCAQPPIPSILACTLDSTLEVEERILEPPRFNERLATIFD